MGPAGSHDGAAANGGEALMQPQWSDQPHPGGPYGGSYVPSSAATFSCRNCGAAPCQLPEATSWRICRCGGVYCQWCIDIPCWDCPAISFWNPESKDEGSDHGLPSADEPGGVFAEDPPEALGQVPCRITPEDAHRWREQALEQHRQQLLERRTRSRGERRAMEREGLRPRRERTRRGLVRVALANVNCIDRFYEEAQHGVCFRAARYVLRQETRTRGEDAARARKKCPELGWDAIGGEAYLKDKRAGGGTMVLMQGEGLWPLAEEEGDYLGRITLCISCELGGVVLGSYYGVSGGKVADQLGGWRRLAIRLAALGRPFIVGADWQIDPDEEEIQRLAQSLGAVVVHPNAATNMHSQSRIDFYVVSKSLLGNGWSIWVDHSCAFFPSRRSGAGDRLDADEHGFVPPLPAAAPPYCPTCWTAPAAEHRGCLGSLDIGFG